MTEAQGWAVIAVMAASVVGVWFMHWKLNRTLDRAIGGVREELDKFHDDIRAPSRRDEDRN
jgi:hypothetical protein